MAEKLSRRKAAKGGNVGRTDSANEGRSDRRTDEMRKRMTLIPREFLTRHPDLAYMGEDVRCGGYYLVTEGSEAKKS